MDNWMKPGISIMMILVVSVSYIATDKVVVNLSCRKPVKDGTECPGNKKCPVNDSCKDPSQCPCMKGYRNHTDIEETRSIIICEDIHECIERTHACGIHTYCNNADGGYFCVCKKGYRRGNETEFCPTKDRDNRCTVSYIATGEAGANLSCRKPVLDGIECSDNKKCPVNGSCDDPSQCPCMEGYRSHNATVGNRSIIICEDINECVEGTNICDANAFCNNTIGGYSCVCFKGFHRGNVTEFCPTNNKTENKCSDIDECEEDPNICGPNTICKNTEGLFQCACTSGSRNISNQCTDCRSNVTQIKYLQHCTNHTIEDPFCSVLNVSISFLIDSCQIKNGNIIKKKAEEDLKQTAEKLSEILANNSIITENIHSGRLITVFLYSMERVVLISFLEEPRVQHIITSELDITLQPSHNICSPGVQSFTLFSANNSMEVPCSLVLRDKGNFEDKHSNFEDKHSNFADKHNTNTERTSSHGGAILITYKELHFYHGNYPGQNNEAVINSRLVTGAITTPQSKNLQPPVTFTLSHLQPLRPFFKFICVFWDPESNDWSDKGCETGQSDVTHTNCSCTHLSSFALLMAPDEIQENFTLTIITYIGLSISVVCLCLTLLTFILCRTLRSNHTSVLSALCGCLFLGQLLFMVGIYQTWNKLLCAFIAGSLQFLFLCAFCWMSIESILLFMTVRNLRAVNYMASRKSNFPIWCLLGFGIPAVIVGITAAARPHEYGSEKNCWLHHGIVWSFLGPVCAIITINTTLLVLTMCLLKKRMASLNANVSTLKNTWLLTFKAVAQLFILGCTWVIGYFQFGPQTLVISYIFTICNTLQGGYIFLVHCLLNQQVREEYCKLFSRYCMHKKQKQDTSTMSTLQTTSKPPLTASTDRAQRQQMDVVSTDKSPDEMKEESV